LSEGQRVLLVLESLGAGGAEIATLNLARALVARGHACEVASLWEPQTLAPRFEDAGISVLPLGLSHRWRVDEGIRRLSTAIREFSPSVVHAQLFFAGLYTALARPRRRDPVRVVTYQNLGYESYPAESVWHRVRKRIDSQAMRRGIDRHVAVSRAVAEHYATHLGVRIDHVVPNGIEARRLADAPIPPRDELLDGLGLPAAAPVLICPARLVHEKGHRFLIEAFRRLTGSRSDPILLLAGDGPLRDEVESQVSEYRLADRVRVLGSVEHRMVLDLMRVADLVVLPSTHEGFPVSIAEAGAVGTPVVASRVGGIPDLIEDGGSGWLVPPGDAGALATALEDALGNPERARALGAAAHRRAIEMCDVDAVARRYEAIYSGDFS
jgi:glycosyltransferase involved in cell wall biosynthesis